MFTAARWPVPKRKGPFFTMAIGRLRPDVSRAAALDTLRATNARLFPDLEVVVPGREGDVGPPGSEGARRRRGRFDAAHRSGGGRLRAADRLRQRHEPAHRARAQPRPRNRHSQRARRVARPAVAIPDGRERRADSQCGYRRFRRSGPRGAGWSRSSALAMSRASKRSRSPGPALDGSRRSPSRVAF